ncbi:MAG: DUF167 family protein [Candidatus Pacebacteria bacterium]|nr:DUF167 family protein [Candidatus Paceibacterota bacterium]
MFIKVKVFPGAKKEKIIKKEEDKFEIHVKEKPERGLATGRTAKILSDYFKVPVSKIRLIKGSKERSKIFNIYV